MEQEIQQIITQLRTLSIKAMERLQKDLVKVRAGKANPVILDHILVEYYGALTPIAQVANISVGDARTLLIQPWEKTSLQPIEKAIQAANMGITPQNDGTIIRLTLPLLTEERRKQLVKQAHSEGELAKISLRNARRDAIEQFRKMNKTQHLSDDALKGYENEVQQITNEYVHQIDAVLHEKEKEITTL